jgi:triacylglycerol lipase
MTVAGSSSAQPPGGGGPPPQMRFEAPANFPKEPYTGVTVMRDVAYGDDAKQKLDVFTPQGGARLPVVIFVHGGGFQGGDKKGVGPLNDNVMLWLNQNKIVGVNINYRLFPAATYPMEEQDVGAAVRWVKANIAKHGGDPNRVILFGHSSGGSLVANYVGTPEIHGAGGPGVKGAILLSAPMDMRTYPGPFKYYGEDPANFATRSPITALLRTKLPLLMGHGDDDLPQIPPQEEAARKALCAAGKCPEFVITGGNHMSEVMAIGGWGDPRFSNAALAFIKRVG